MSAPAVTLTAAEARETARALRAWNTAPFYNVTLHVSVRNKREMHYAAFEHAMESGCSVRDAYQMLGTKRAPDVGNCLRMLLDPGLSPPGIEIHDSSVE